MATLLFVVSGCPIKVSMVVIISMVLFCLTHFSSRVSLSPFHSKNKSSSTSSFHTPASNGGRVT